jgi:hypothetical protein
MNLIYIKNLLKKVYNERDYICVLDKFLYLIKVNTITRTLCL